MAASSKRQILDGRYRLLGHLGGGATSTVLGAFDDQDRRWVALKVAKSRRDFAAFLDEFAVGSAIDHPNIVRTHRVGRHRNRPYLVLEYVAGGRVASMLIRRGARRPDLERVASQLLEALGAIHSAGYVHRDLGPSNVLANPTPRGPLIKLIDFGLACRIGSGGELGRLTGSMASVAPETLGGAAHDPRSDLYGLGVTLFRLATGRHPAGSHDGDRLLDWHLNGGPADPPRRFGVSPGLSSLIRRLTAKDPAERPSTTVQALAVLRRSEGRATVSGSGSRTVA